MDRANEWWSRSFGGGSPRAPHAASHAGAGALRVPVDTDVTVRYIFSLTNPGLVKPLGDGLPLRADDAETQLHAAVVQAHFDAHRPTAASFPALATEVIDAADRPDADLSHLARLVEHDPTIGAMVLRIANSALYHRDAELSSIKLAVAHLGLTAVAQVAAGVTCRSLFDAASRAEHDLYPQLWRELFLRSMTVAYAASQFSSERGVGRPDQVFLAGMFHDVGKALALRSLCALVLEGRIARPDEARVGRVLERVHVSIGCAAHAAWQLPQFLTTICRRHHDDDVVPSPDYDELHILRVVSGLNALRVSANFDRRTSRQVRASVNALGITQPQLRALTSSIREAQERVFDLFGAQASSSSPPSARLYGVRR